MSDGTDTRRLAFFSPLPPAASGIADYTADLLPLLPAEWEVDVWLDDPVGVDASLVPRGRARALADAGSETLSDYDLCVYQIGNGNDHLPVLPLVRSHPGLLVLHDGVLHPSRVHAAAAAGDLDGYRHVAADARPDLGRRLGDLVASGLWGPSLYWTFPLCEDLVRASRLTVVHGELTAGWLRALVPGAGVSTVDHWRAVPKAPADRVQHWRDALGARADTPLIGSFGHVGAAHGIELFLAVAGELAGDHDFRIVVAGSIDPDLDLQAAAAAAGIADRVTVTGRVPATDFAALMASVDLAVNLRYPTARASSGTLHQLLQLGVPSIVHDLLHQRDLPAAGVLRVPPGPRDAERRALRRCLADWLANPDARAAAAATCRAWAAAHVTPENMARSYVDAVLEALERAPAA